MEFAQRCAELGIALTTGQLEAFEDFENELYAANEFMNLTRIKREDCWRLHFLDSLLLSPYIPKCSKVLDIGTGPGFPAWPLAAAREDLMVTAMDSSGKMLGFLAKSPLSNLALCQGRAEDRLLNSSFDLVTGRALAPFAIQMEISARYAINGGILAPLRTPKDQSVVERFPYDKLSLSLEDIHLVPLPGTDIVRLIPMVRKRKQTPKLYPRAWAQIKNSPLG